VEDCSLLRKTDVLETRSPPNLASLRNLSYRAAVYRRDCCEPRASELSEIWHSGLVGWSPMDFHSDFDGALKVQGFLLMHECADHGPQETACKSVQRQPFKDNVIQTSH
jgi:hypothetical protein